MKHAYLQITTSEQPEVQWSHFAWQSQK